MGRFREENPGPQAHFASSAWEAQLSSCRAGQAALRWEVNGLQAEQLESVPCGQTFQDETIQFSRSVITDSATPWTAARQASLSITNSRSPPKLMSIELVMPSNHLILCRPLLCLPSILPSSRVFFQMSQLFTSDGQSIGVSASASVLPMNIQD